MVNRLDITPRSIKSGRPNGFIPIVEDNDPDGTAATVGAPSIGVLKPTRSFPLKTFMGGRHACGRLTPTGDHNSIEHLRVCFENDELADGFEREFTG